MRGRSTLIFAVIVLALAGYTFYDFQHNRKETLGENEVKVVTVPADDFSEVVIKGKTQTLQLKKDGGVWKMLQPVIDETDAAAVTAFVTSLSSAKAQTIMDGESKGPIDWSKYGLSPGISIEITSVKGGKTTFAISDSNAFDGSYYVRKDDQLYLGDRSWSHFVDRQAEILRSHKIWRAEGAVIEVHLHYDYNGKTEDATFTKDENGSWKATPAFDLPISSDKMMSWFDEFKDLRVLDFAAPSLRPDDKKKFLLTKPSMKIELKVKKDDKVLPVEWTIGQDHDNDVFIVASDRPDVFKIGKFLLRNVRVPAERLLDTAAVMQFPVEEAREVRFQHDGQTLHFVKGEKDWTMAPPPKEGAFNPERLADFFEKLRSLEPLSDVAPADVKFQPGNELTIVGKDKTLLRMSWSNDKEMLRWLKINKFKEEMKVSSERLKAILNIKFNAPPSPTHVSAPKPKDKK